MRKEFNGGRSTYRISQAFGLQTDICITFLLADVSVSTQKQFVISICLQEAIIFLTPSTSHLEIIRLKENNIRRLVLLSVIVRRDWKKVNISKRKCLTLVSE